jgi:hypothetical protein
MSPSSKKLRTMLLVKAKKEVDKLLAPIKSAWPSSIVSIVPSPHKFHGVIKDCTRLLIFLKAVDCLGKYKDANYMGDLFLEVIEEVAVVKIFQVLSSCQLGLSLTSSWL